MTFIEKEQFAAPFLFYIQAMRLLSLLCVLFLLMTGCQPAKVVYAKYGRMKLEVNEQSHYPVGVTDIVSFEQCCSVESDAIFLNRVISNLDQNYTVYISVSETMLQSDFASAQASDSRVEVLSTASSLVQDIKVNTYLVKKSDFYAARFTYIEARSGLLVIYDVASRNKAFIVDVLNRNESYIHEKIRL